MSMKRFFETARIGMKESRKEADPLLGSLFGWMGCCFGCSLVIGLIVKCLPGENDDMLSVLVAFLGIAIGTGLYAFVDRVKETMRIVDETGVDTKTAWRQADHDSCGEFM